VGNYVVFIDGGTGLDTLTINAGAQNFTVVNQQGQVIYQQGTGGSLITVCGVECLTVFGQNGEEFYGSC
jgi:hypothetical protein